jgi:tetratricopeptide (TPR) repeat protein
MGSQEDFFGGYDYKAQAGIIHVANHHISPGKKQWTWGNHDFGYAWDRNLTERDAQGEFGPYIEIMAGVFTDNQPDFSFLLPGETKTWSQFWYPIQKIGPAQHANLDAALHFQIVNRRLIIGVAVTRNQPQTAITLWAKGKKLASFVSSLSPAVPLVKEIRLPKNVAETDLRICVTGMGGQQLISYQPRPREQRKVPPPATEPLPPEEIASNDELFITGLHLEQYRHATRSSVLYWREALRRDPFDSRSNNALGLWHLRRGELTEAEKHFRNAIERLTRRNANPCDGEALFNLGQCLRLQGDFKSEISNLKFTEAYASFYKATWNQAWAAAGYHALAELDCRRKDWVTAVGHLERSLRFDTENLRARNLLVLVLRKLSRQEEAERVLNETLKKDPLDWWARQLRDDDLSCDLQTRLDLAHDFARTGFFEEAICTLQDATATPKDLPDQSWGALPMVHYALGWLYELTGDKKKALAAFQRAGTLPGDYCFPSRLEEIAILQAAMRARPHDARAPYYLGNLLYDRRRHREAIQLWEKSAKLNPKFSIVWRNLGIGYFNVSKKPARARAAYDRAFAANPGDTRLLFERDQLWKRLGESPGKRLRMLEKYPDLVALRDDLSVELCALYNQTGQAEKALARLRTRNFQPWEGGEGGPLGQWVRAHLALGRIALQNGETATAIAHFREALQSPLNLGEAKHLLANQSDIHYWLGRGLSAAGDLASARKHWDIAANFKGDFQEMRARAFSEMTYYSALAWVELGRRAKAQELFRDLLSFAQAMQKSSVRIDYFATSLPTMLLFEDDLQLRQETTALFLQAQAMLGLGKKARASSLLHTVLRWDPNHAAAADLLAGQAHEHDR